MDWASSIEPSSTGLYGFDQDEQGFVWIGTRNGLDRIDGYSIKNFRHDPGATNGISANDVRTLAATRDGIVWVGGHAAGLDRFDTATGTAINFRNRPGAERDIGSDQIQTVIEDRRGNIWVSTVDAGISHIDPETLAVTRFSSRATRPNHIPDDEILSIHAAKSGRLWVATKDGLVYCDDVDVGFKPATFLEGAVSDSVVVTVVRETSNGSLFLETSDGMILRYRPGENDEWNVADLTMTIPRQDIGESEVWNSWLLDSNDRIWMPRFDVTIVYDTIIDEYVTLAMPDVPMFEDRSGILWRSGDVIERLDPESLIFGDIVDEIHARTEAEVSLVFAVLETPDLAVWLAEPNGVWRYEAGTNQVNHYAFYSELGPDPNDTNTLLYDDSGIVWAGAFFSGMNQIDSVGGQTKNYPLCQPEVIAYGCNTVWALERDDQGTLWVGSANELHKYDQASDSFVGIDVPVALARSMLASGVRALEAGRNNVLWIGTESGLLRWQRDDNDWTWFVHDPNQNDGLSSSYINFLYEDGDGKLWIATQLGLHHLDPATGDISRFNTATGLPNDDINAIVEDSYGAIWVSTGKGLAAIDAESFDTRVFNRNNGLPNDEFLLASAHAGQSGTVYFGTSNSVVYFDPGKLAVSSAPPDIVLTELRIDNETILPNTGHPDEILEVPINLTQSFTIPYQQSALSIEFAGIHFADPMQNSYAYKLDGYDDDWVYTDSRHRIANYASLPPGRYRFRVRAANKYGVWNESERTLDITILTPLSQTWWAYTFYVVAFLAMVSLIVRLRTRTHVVRATELEAAVEERTRQIKRNEQLIREQAMDVEELLRMKDKLFTNISHEFRTPLTLILGPANRMLESGPSEKQATNLNLIKHNGQRLLRLVDQLLDLAKLDSEQPVVREPQPISQIVNAVAQSFSPLARSRGVTFDTDIVVDTWVEGSIDTFEKILMNLLSNAFKYTPIGGYVSLSLLQNDDGFVSLIVSDSGVGIPPERQQQIYDRFSRVDDTGENVPGAGIGLALVKELVMTLDGSIHVKSVPGEGTTFTVKFHHHRGNVTAAEKAPDIELSDASFLELENLSRSSYVTKEAVIGEDPELPSVLVIEDNPDMQRYLLELLASRYSCTSAVDGESGLQMGLEQIPDLVLCDVMMPKMNGFDVSQNLKSDERTSHIPIIMLTARGDHESRIRGLREKVDDYLAKPFDDEELLLRMQNILDAREGMRKRYANKLFGKLGKGNGLNSREEEFLAKLTSSFERHLSDTNFRVDQMSSEMAMSERNLHRKLKALTGYTPAQYLRSYRLNKALELLRDGMIIYQVAEAVGFSSPAYFSSCFKEEFGMPPSKLT